MNDPFAFLREELVRAAGREPRRSRLSWPPGWLRRRSHPVAVVVAALVVCGSAAGAVFSLTASRSQQLTGHVPGRPTVEQVKVGKSTTTVALSYNGDAYTVAIVPSLDAGGAGWDYRLVYERRGVPAGGERGGLGGYLTRKNPILVDSSLSTFGTGRSIGPQGRRVAFALTADNVAAVRVGNETIRTFSSPDLPSGDRAAVFFVPGLSTLTAWSPGGPPLPKVTVPVTPGKNLEVKPGARDAVTRESGSSSVTITIPASRRPHRSRGGPPRPQKTIPVPPASNLKVKTLLVTPLDSEGRALPASLPGTPVGPVTRFWQAPSAITPGNESPPYRGPSRPLPGVCELSQHGLPALTPEWGHALGAITPASGAVGEIFLSCVNTEYFLDNWPLEVAVLLDGRQPGRTLGPLPGAVTVSGHPGTVEIGAGSITARRIGNAWLVVQGGASQAQRLAVLNALGLARLDLHHIHP